MLRVGVSKKEYINERVTLIQRTSNDSDKERRKKRMRKVVVEWDNGMRIRANFGRLVKWKARSMTAS